jgi:hypothetical protein
MLEELEASLVKAEKSMNTLKLKLADECQVLRYSVVLISCRFDAKRNEFRPFDGSSFCQGMWKNFRSFLQDKPDR